MTDRSPWIVALVAANLVFLVAAAFFVRARLIAVEDRLATTAPARPPAASRGEERPVAPAPAGATDDPASLAGLSKRIQKLSDDSYENYTEVMSDLHELKRQTKQTSAAVRRIAQGLASPGAPVGSWNLRPLGSPLTPEALAAYRKDAEAWGVTVTPGRVEVRGVLNMSPWSTMPIEYFLTRWPESGHETLLHVLGPAPIDDTLGTEKLQGLVTAIYKGLLVAGFEQGEGAGYEPPTTPGGKPRWIAPKGDVVHVGVRYALHGKVHLARATDWVVDPSTHAVLPADAFHFTGSRRQEDFQTGDEQISAEASGVVVSVYMDPNSLLEIAEASVLENRYQYNYVRIPQPVILVLEGKAGLVDAIRDRAHNGIRLLTLERGGKTEPLTSAPVLRVPREDGKTDEIPFTKVADGWEVRHDALAKGEWRVRVDVDGKGVESVAFQPLYLDLVFSKTPLEVQGDGALPMAPPELPTELPAGTGTARPAGHR